MTTVYLAPTYGAGYQAFGTTGLPLNAGLLYTYIAGGTTPQATYTTSAGTVQNANPVVLGADGRPPSEIWFTSGVSYRFDLKDSLGNLIKTDDNLYGIGDPNAFNVGAAYWILSSASGANTITAAASAGCALTTGNIYVLPAASTNAAGAVTLNITPAGGVALGAKSVLKRTSGGLVALVANDFIASAEQILVYDGTQFVVIGSRPYAQGANIASAATINLDTATGDYVQITGSTGPVTAITLAQGEERTLEFVSTPTLTNGASLILPGGANIVAAAGDTAIFRGEASGVVRCISYFKAAQAPISFAPIANSLSGDVALNNTANFFDGPSVAQGTVGTWLATGTVSLQDTGVAAQYFVKLWDGTTVIDSCVAEVRAANSVTSASLSGCIASPAGNIRISVRDITANTGKILFNSSGTSKDSTVTAIRIA